MSLTAENIDYLNGELLLRLFIGRLPEAKIKQIF
jgi:hypothetical protein